eukprot:CAMPEP_0169310840 /NCGR_PEP_ID=MMETSP1017-20121227/3186_1 /TAXON_ID=342587 /ORGANISM="Karlodinium micrum, Strain CCMP2283" /LENGTH=843 /DNA_ID=CAMNT_0009404513 /DNA_START=25 /DNA_END=2553 /DNA_ORIENTATION=-
MSGASLRELGNAFFKACDYNRAVKAYTDSIKEEENSQTYSDRALCFLRMHRWNLAFRDAKTTVEMTPSFAEGYHHIACACMHLEKQVEAERWLNTGIEKTAHESLSTLLSDIQRGEFLTRYRQPQESEVTASTASDRKPRSMVQPITLAEIMEKLTDPKKLRKNLKYASEYFKSGAPSQLQIALAFGDVEAVKHLLVADLQQLESADPQGNRPLHITAMLPTDARAEAMLELLFEFKANVDPKNNDNMTPLFLAARLGVTQRVRLLLHFKADPRAFNHEGTNALTVAVITDRLETVNLLLEHTEPDLVNMNGTSPLQFAAKGASQPVIRSLIERRADVNFKQVGDDALAITPLHFAISRQELDIVILLIDARADPYYKDDLGRLVSQSAVQYSRSFQKSFFKLLSERFPDSSIPTAIAQPFNSTSLPDLHLEEERQLRMLQDRKQVEYTSKLDQSEYMSGFDQWLRMKGNGSVLPIQDCSDLHLACTTGHLPTMKKLLLEGADANEEKRGGLPLSFAVRSPAAVEMLLEHRANPCGVHTGICGLLQSVLHDSIDAPLESVRLLLDASAEVNVGCLTEGTSPLHAAAVKKDLHKVRLLLDRRADVNQLSQRDGNSQNALLGAIQVEGSQHLESQIDVVRLLLEFRAQTSAKGVHSSPLYMACENGAVDLVDLLLEYKADADELDPDGATPLLGACAGGSLKIVQNLLAICQRPLDYQVRKGSCFSGLTAVFMAAQEGRAAILSLLLKARASPSLGDDKSSPLSIACHTAHNDCVRILIQARADVNYASSVQENCFTALHICAKRNNVDALRMLIEAKADTLVYSRTGLTPKALAQKIGSSECYW